MKLQKLYHLIALGSVLALATSGCKHTPLGPTPIGSRSGTAAIPGDGGPITEGNPNFNRNPVTPEVVRSTLPPRNDLGPGPGIKNTGTTENLNPTPVRVEIPSVGVPSTDPTNFDTFIPDRTILQADTIYFDYDKSAVKASEESKLNDAATYWKAHPADAIRIEGNCDERGTEEYNRSLGDRRAMAAREYLVSQGVNPAYILTVSYGKDKPVDTGHDEAAYSKNRRDDFVVLVPPSKP